MTRFPKSFHMTLPRLVTIFLFGCFIGAFAILSFFHVDSNDNSTSRSEKLLTFREKTVATSWANHSSASVNQLNAKYSNTIPLRNIPDLLELNKEIALPNLLQVENVSTIGQLHFVTYASHRGRDDRFCRAIESAVRHKIDLVLLGWNVPWRGLSQKLEAAHAYASSLPQEDIILFTDAFDVIFTSSSVNISNIFTTMKSDLVFSAECGCWPHVAENREACFRDYPISPTPYRYLNSGTWIGFAKAAKEMLHQVIQEAGKNFDMANDQKLIADFYIAGRFGIKLDFFNALFQSMHMTLDPPLPHCDPTEDVVLDSHGQWYNKRTHSNPSVIHFNGGGKTYHLRMESKMWYKQKKYNTEVSLTQLKDALISVPNQPNGKMRFEAICSDYIQKEYSRFTAHDT